MIVRFSLAANHYALMLSLGQVLLINKLKVLGLIDIVEH
jgi:hypothetical protein